MKIFSIFFRILEGVGGEGIENFKNLLKIERTGLASGNSFQPLTSCAQFDGTYRHGKPLGVKNFHGMFLNQG